MKSRPAAALLLTLGLGSAAFLHQPTTARSTLAAPLTLRVAIFAPNVPTDTALMSGTFFGIEKAVCSTLVAYPERRPPGATHLVPEVAAGIKVSKDGRTYRFKVRTGFRFSDGKKVTAASFAAAINRDLNPQLASAGASYLHEVVGADAVLDGNATRAAGVRTRGNTLIVKLTRRTDDFLPRLTLPPFCPVPPGTPAAPLDRPAASGPYYFASYEPRRTLVLKRNPFYHGNRPHRAREIDWT